MSRQPICGCPIPFPSPISSYNYGVDGLGNMTSLVDHLGRITNWRDDPTNQLTVDNYLPATGGVAEKSWA